MSKRGIDSEASKRAKAAAEARRSAAQAEAQPAEEKRNNCVAVPQVDREVARARDVVLFAHDDSERAESRRRLIEARPRVLAELERIALNGESEKARIMAAQVLATMAERVTPLAIAGPTIGTGSALPPGAQLVAGEQTSTSTTRAGTKTETKTKQVGILAPDFKF